MKNKTDHNPHIVKKVDWDERIKMITEAFYNKNLFFENGQFYIGKEEEVNPKYFITSTHKKVDWDEQIGEIFIKNQNRNGGCICVYCIIDNKNIIKQLLFRYGEFLIFKDGEANPKHFMYGDIPEDTRNSLREELRKRNEEVLE